MSVAVSHACVSTRLAIWVPLTSRQVAVRAFLWASPVALPDFGNLEHLIDSFHLSLVLSDELAYYGVSSVQRARVTGNSTDHRTHLNRNRGPRLWRTTRALVRSGAARGSHDAIATTGIHGFVPMRRLR